MALRLFVDFDGTITRRDVGNIFFRSFGGAACDELVRRYHDEEFGARELFRGEARAMGRFRMRSLEAVVDAEAIDPAFRTLVAFCGARDIPLMVLSDGLDYYIRRILEREGCAGVPFASNRALFSAPDGDGNVELGVEFPHADASCDRCACCKRNVMLAASGEDDRIAYVGEGYSDRCPVRYADIVFAKDSLQTYCQNENITYTPYTTFDDVVARLSSLLERPGIPRRERAERERRAAFRHES